MRRILLLTDHSKNAINALHYAAQLFTAQKCIFHLCHVRKAKHYISDDLMTSGSKSLYGALVKDEKQKLRDLVQNIKSRYNNERHQFKVTVDVDTFIDAIRQNIEIHHIDLIIMGSNGVSNTREAIFGSNTLKVIRHINIPTLVVPENYKYTPLQDILLPLEQYDLKEDEIFKTFIEFSAPFKSKLHILRILESNGKDQIGIDEKKHLNDLAREHVLEYHAIKKVPLQYSVHQYIQTHHIDLMVLFVQTESFFDRFFFGSTTTQFSKELELPLLIYHY